MRSSFFHSNLPTWLCWGLLAALPLSPAFSDTGAPDRSRLRVAALDREVAPGEEGAIDVPWSAVVRDIQRELQDLGLYGGPIDGRYSAEVRNAIERFERLHGKIGEGAPLAAALRSIVSVRDGLKLRRSLDEIRERQTKAALQALRASPETRDLVDPPARAGAGEKAPAREDCRRDVSVDCLLADARMAVRDVEQASFRDWALREIILTEIRTGRGSAAVRDRLRQLNDPRLVLVAMREMAEALAEAGRTADALDLAETVPDRENRIRALAAIAVSAAAQGDTGLARRLAQRVVDALRAETALPARVAIATSLASGLAQKGDIDTARGVLQVARRFASPDGAGLIRRAELGLETGALTESGRYGEAADTLAALVEGASSMIAASASAVSRASSAEADRYRVTTLCNLGVIQAKAGNAAGAAQTLDKAAAVSARIRRGYPSDYARYSVALARAQIGSYGQAAETLGNVDSALLRAEGYWRVAELAARGGSAAEADALEARAYSIASAVENNFDRTILLSDMAIAAARARRMGAARRIFDGALDAGMSLDAGWWRARALARLAAALHAMSGADGGR